MSHLKYYAYEGVGGESPNTSRQEGVEHAASSSFTNSLSDMRGKAAGTMTARSRQKINAQIDCAFANVEKNLKDAGGKGWSQVFRVDSYHVPLDDEAPAAMIRNFAKYMPDHQPIWTCVGVPRLGEEAMKVEFAVVAHDPEGAKTA
ncbi:hypothetical protein BN1723_006193 [Verticillium longisporum]|uniref:Uncharacterized protein n=1 Tax=Verticillium longisporum TaxID=100787 RepID=A0A0G4NE66_VERLO|nr:hypothetical protein BN1723_006193 [Verticillium longisporum]